MMKMLIGGLAAVFVATATLAQSTPPPTEPMNSPGAVPPADTAAPGAQAAEASAAPQLVQKNGKWWNGDRKATRTEIAQYKAANPRPPG